MNLLYTIDKGISDIIIGDLIIGDPGRIRQMLDNLLSNAVKFTDEGKVKISVLSQEIDGTNEVHFAAQEIGIYIAQDSMNQLFHPFTQTFLIKTEKQLIYK